MNYSQGGEQDAITAYFGGTVGTLLSIGENDGITFSNARRLIELGWSATLIEPSSAFYDLEKLYEDNAKVQCYKLAIGEKTGKGILHESGPHLPDKSDKALLSTLDETEKKRWRNVAFQKKEVDVVTWQDFPNKKAFDFISIDAESLDLAILKQIDLTDTKLLCIEFNSNEYVKAEIFTYCEKFGLTNLLLQNAENVILAR